MRITIYHSRDWELLVETGWLTAYVETLSNGDRIAYMWRADYV